MAHKHSIYDTDPHFKIDPVTRAMTTAEPKKVSVMQYDHNSERFTFEVPRFIDGHDMSLCQEVQVHYLNIHSQTMLQNEGVYEVDDLQISPDDDVVVILSWLISQNATQFPGVLNFLIRFMCVSDGGKVDYVWNTGIYTGISVSAGIYNGEAVVEDYADILAQWEARISALEQTGGARSWNDLEDKPFGDTYKTVYGETYVEVGSNYHTTLTEFPKIELDKTYVLIVDGVEYECVPWLDEATPCIALGYQENYPFWIFQTVRWTTDGYVYDDYENGTIFQIENVSYMGEHLLHVVTKEAIPLDEKFIPETIARVDDIPKNPVKSVNGITPDENGNVEVEIPEGFSGSWNDLVDKPFGDGITEQIIEKTTHTFDEEYSYTDLLNINKAIIPNETYTIIVNGIEYQSIAWFDAASNFVMIGEDNRNCPLWIYQDVNYDSEYVNTENGTHVQLNSYNLVAGNYTFSVVCDKPLQQLDEKYIPYTTEEWVFELEDGSTVTKQVVVK